MQRLRSSAVIAALAGFVLMLPMVFGSTRLSASAAPAGSATPTPVAPAFDQKAALAKLREQIKGREKEPASAVFKNIQILKERPAGQLLAMMELGYARSLGIDCTHCHVPEKWESEENPNKQIAREMAAMTAKINNDLLRNIKNLSQTPVVNCTTCHRGQVRPALNLPS